MPRSKDRSDSREDYHESKRSTRREQTPQWVINAIFEGKASGGTSSSVRRAYAHQVKSVDVSSMRKQVKDKGPKDPVLSFSKKDLEHVLHHHDNALVISTRFAAYTVKQILVGTRSSVDILFLDAFNQMGLAEESQAGKPALNVIKAFARTFHLKLKFPPVTESGRSVETNQRREATM
ncbi:hypothetical protein CRG98_011744 [Punica granatum]|uniref:Uncharacterized protein n=1 Tax=Punica granatum TaxID=22663 RepID=A0A2I0KH57_PUNGR|nr:hypothetical protein CRG98_011744 [Punica granatum]